MITTTTYERVAALRIERQDRRNALNTEHCRQLRESVDAAVAAGARAMVITGQGSSFCAGADFDEVYSDGFREALYGALRAVSEAPLPVLAAVNGPAVGAGTGEC